MGVVFRTSVQLIVSPQAFEEALRDQLWRTYVEGLQKDEDATVANQLSQ